MLSIFSRKVNFSLSSIVGFNIDELIIPDRLKKEPDLKMINALYRSTPPFIAIARKVNGQDKAQQSPIEEIANNFQNTLIANKSDLAVHPVTIHPIDEDLNKLIASNQLEVLSNQYVFVQNVQREVSQSIYETVFDIQSKGFKPVLVFPGQDPYFKNNKQRLMKLMSRNCLFQINILALTGQWGSDARQTAEFLLENKRVKFISWQINNLSQSRQANTIRVSPRIAELLTNLSARDIHSSFFWKTSQ